ncbi:amino acid permease [Burkholderia contaminans]|uniref:Amino acid permease n=1 Tax=Burkholderia contaminans TaxID=488447 RepID=A0A3N8PTE9_9BURK|nr:amino acid permease [Burkholderia contaminans]RQT14887.1 amino acid permease [Burkholderia contaminans]
MRDRQEGPEQLKRQLGNRHIQLIALGGTIGTGLFLGSAGVLELAGPSMVLGYAVAGFVAFLIMRFLGEMLVEDPVPSSFWCEFSGFFAGWSCCVLYILVGMLELTAAGKFIQFWWPAVPMWATAALFFVVVNAMNFVNVRLYGESEFWFSMIKIAAVVGMIVLGLYLLISGSGGPHATVTNLWRYGGFFPNGVHGLVMAMAFIVFSFGGLEMLGFTAAETASPGTTIPKAINQVIFRVLIFYVGSMLILLCLMPWTHLLASLKSGADTYSNSPFVMIFSRMGNLWAADALNFIILTAALSVYNGMVYCNSRLLYGMASQGHAPRSLMQVNGRGVPTAAILLPAAFTALCVILNYVLPNGAIELLISLIVACLIFCWAIVIIVHMKFRRQMRRAGRITRFKAIASPASNIFCLAFLVMIVAIIVLTPSIRVSAYVMPVWLAIVYVAYRATRRYREERAADLRVQGAA